MTLSKQEAEAILATPFYRATCSLVWLWLRGRACYVLHRTPVGDSEASGYAEEWRKDPARASKATP